MKEGSQLDLSGCDQFKLLSAKKKKIKVVVEHRTSSSIGKALPVRIKLFLVELIRNQSTRRHIDCVKSSTNPGEIQVSS